MKLRTLVLTVAILAVLSAVVYFLNRPAPPPSADPRVGQLLVAPATIEKSAGLRLSDQGKTVTVSRQADGTWRVATYHDLPADFEKLARFTAELSDAHLKRLVTSSPERIARLEFKDTKVELLDATGQALWAVTLGKTAENGDGRYVRFGDEPKAFLADLRAWLDADSKNWADSRLVSLPAEEIATLEISLADGSAVKISRPKKDDAWTAESAPANQKLKNDRVASALTSLTSLRFTDTFESADAHAAIARQHVRTFKLTTFDHKTLTIALGRKPEEKKLKPPAPSTDGKSGPAALGSVADISKTESKEATASADVATKTTGEAGPKPLAPEYETIPAGPVFAFLSHSDPAAPVNALMQKRTFQVGDYVYTGLPQNAADLFEAAPPPPAPVAPGPVAPSAAPAAAPASAPTPTGATPAPAPTATPAV